MTLRVFTPLQVTLHWLSAAVILWALCSGFLVAFADLPATIKIWISGFNVSLTTLLTPLFALRMALAWRHRHRCVQAPGLMGHLARQAHRALYAVTALVLLTGVLMMDRDIEVFGLLRLPALVDDPLMLRRYHAIHLNACVVLAGLLVAHLGAVVMHHWRRTPVLQRMWF